jgi:DNA-binding PadR family transcriptional regulator
MTHNGDPGSVGRHNRGRRGGPRGFGRGRSRGGSMRRGQVRFLILAVLTEGPMHGYQVIQELESRSNRRWRPSAGSVYPTLQQLEDEGLVRSNEEDGRRVYTLTDEGRTAGEEVLAGSRRLFDFGSAAEGADLRRLALQLVQAAVQVQRIGSPQAQRDAQAILIEGRRGLYRLLAEDEEEPANEPKEGAEA